MCWVIFSKNMPSSIGKVLVFSLPPPKPLGLSSFKTCNSCSTVDDALIYMASSKVSIFIVNAIDFRVPNGNNIEVHEVNLITSRKTLDIKWFVVQLTTPSVFVSPFINSPHPFYRTAIRIKILEHQFDQISIYQRFFFGIGGYKKIGRGSMSCHP